MTNDRSRQKLLEFLDYLADKGLMNRTTIIARRVAVTKVLGILPDEEASDVTKLDLENVMVRFQNLEGKKYTPGSLSTYLSRVKSAIDDFRSYLDNPLGFRPSVQARDKRKPNSKRETSGETDTAHQRGTESHAPRAPLSSSILPIPIRSETTVFIQGLPYDLTEAEANKIANVVRAMAMSA